MKALLVTISLIASFNASAWLTQPNMIAKGYAAQVKLPSFEICNIVAEKISHFNMSSGHVEFTPNCIEGEDYAVLTGDFLVAKKMVFNGWRKMHITAEDLETCQYLSEVMRQYNSGRVRVKSHCDADTLTVNAKVKISDFFN